MVIKNIKANFIFNFEKIKKNQIEKKILQIIKKKTPNKISKMNKNEDLYKKQLVDSFDLKNILEKIEEKFDIEINIEKIKKFKFSIIFLSELVNKKIK